MSYGVHGDAIAETRLLPSDLAPDFKSIAVIDGEFKECSLSQYRGKYLVLFFYPLDFTFVCPTELTAFSDRIEQFRARNCEVLACSTDSEYCHLAWTRRSRKEGGIEALKYPLLSDKTHAIGEAYGVIKPHSGVACRALFVIDGAGAIRHVSVNDMAVGRSVDEVIRVLDALQHFDEHGEVCPADWRKGARAIRPTVAASGEYFSRVE